MTVRHFPTKFNFLGPQAATGIRNGVKPWPVGMSPSETAAQANAAQALRNIKGVDTGHHALATKTDLKKLQRGAK